MHPPPNRDDYFDMIAGISRFTAHALGNPLTGLGLTLDLLASANTPSTAQRLVDRCQRINERLSEFKENLGALGGGLLRHGLGRVALVPLIKAAMDAAHLSGSYDTPIDTPDGQEVDIVCHAGLIASAIGYLLRNASDALPDTGTIGARLRVHGDMLRVTIFDSGPGVPAELVPKLFAAPFTTKEHGGGMGLLLVAMIVERIHGGRLSFSPNAPHGAQFHLDLPTHGKVAAIS